MNIIYGGSFGKDDRDRIDERAKRRTTTATFYVVPGMPLGPEIGGEAGDRPSHGGTGLLRHRLCPHLANKVPLSENATERVLPKAG